ncbi:MAG: zinc ribbon domain-containing protein [Candidatus Aquicultorales bacterium]
MGEFEQLLKLQEVDLKLDALDDREKTLPERERFQELERQTAEMAAALAKDEELLHKEKQAQKKIEDELTALAEKIEREQKKLYGGTVTSPKELAGIQQEIDSLKERRDEVETALLEQLDVVEPMDKEVAVIADRLDELKADRKEAEGAYEAVSQEIATARAGLTAERESLVPTVEKTQLGQYEKVRKRHRKAVAGIADGICQGCHTDIPAVELKKIKEAQGLAKCPNCGRLLVKE